MGWLSPHVNITLNRAEQLSVPHGPQEPTILVFQSVFSSSMAQLVLPPLETSIHGSSYPGKFATVHPDGIGTSHVRPCSPFTMPRLQMDSVRGSALAATPPLQEQDSAENEDQRDDQCQVFHDPSPFSNVLIPETADVFPTIKRFEHKSK